MAEFTATVEVDLYDFDDEEIIEYLEDQGYTVIAGEDAPDEYQDVKDFLTRELEHAAWEYKHGSVIEAVKILEQCFPDFKGLSQKIV